MTLYIVSLAALVLALLSSIIAYLLQVRVLKRAKAESERHRVLYHECNQQLAIERDRYSEQNDLFDKYIINCNSIIDISDSLRAKLSSYENHPDEAVRMALYPKQRLVISTPGCPIAGGGTIIDFEGALELDGDTFQIESPVKIRGKWSSEGLVMFPLDPTQDIPAMDKLEVFIYVV